MPAILLDTHAAIWSISGTVGSASARTIDAAARRAELLISPVTAWEIGMLVHKGRLVLADDVHDFVRALFARPGVTVAALTPAIAVEASTMPPGFRGDPADRMIVATAAAYRAILVTRDKAIHQYAKATKYVRCLTC